MSMCCHFRCQYEKEGTFAVCRKEAGSIVLQWYIELGEVPRAELEDWHTHTYVAYVNEISTGSRRSSMIEDASYRYASSITKMSKSLSSWPYFTPTTLDR